MKTLTLFVTQRCNRKCVYCDIPHIKNKKTFDKNLFKEYLPLINKSDFDMIVLTGGEPGLLNNESMKLIFQIEKDIEVNTNGVFIKRYFTEYRDRICNVMYHPVMDIDEEIKIRYTDDKIHYIVPVHRKNVHLLKSFLKRYSDVIFKLSPYDSKYTNKFTLLKNQYEEIYNIIRECGNITNSTIDVFKRIKDISDIGLKTLRSKCTGSFLEVDFVNGLINNCVCSYTRSSKIDLTYDNFKNIESLKFQKTKICDTCLSVVILFDEILKSSMKVENEKIFN